MNIRDRKKSKQDIMRSGAEHVDDLPDYEALGISEIDLDRIKAEIGTEEER